MCDGEMYDLVVCCELVVVVYEVVCCIYVVQDVCGQFVEYLVGGCQCDWVDVVVDQFCVYLGFECGDLFVEC